MNQALGDRNRRCGLDKQHRDSASRRSERPSAIGPGSGNQTDDSALTTSAYSPNHENPLVYRSGWAMKIRKAGLVLRSPMPANLMAIDVGFSAIRPTTGLACLEGDQLTLERAGTAWESRAAKTPKDFEASAVAIDGPLLPLGERRT